MFWSTYFFHCSNRLKKFPTSTMLICCHRLFLQLVLESVYPNDPAWGFKLFISTPFFKSIYVPGFSLKFTSCSYYKSLMIIVAIVMQLFQLFSTLFYQQMILLILALVSEFESPNFFTNLKNVLQKLGWKLGSNKVANCDLHDVNKNTLPTGIPTKTWKMLNILDSFNMQNVIKEATRVTPTS